MAEVHAARIAERDATIASQAAKIERLREALIAVMPYAGGKAYHTAIAALQPKEGE
jgi:hypothetical protein